MSDQSQAVTLSQGKEVTAPKESRFNAFRTTLTGQKQSIEKVLPAHISYEKFQSVVMTACMQNPDLLGAQRSSLLLSCVKAATDGLLPDGRDAALVIFNAKLGKDERGKDVYGQKVQYMPMYAGILKKVRQSGELSSVSAHVVYKADKFQYLLGDEDKIVHEPNMTDEDRGPVIAAYCIAKLKDGTIVKEVMTRADIEKVRKTSKSGAMTEHDVKKAGGVGKPGDPKGIWRDWYEEMAKKTVFRRISKWLPQSIDKGDLVRAFDNDETMEMIEGSTEDGEYTLVEGDGTGESLPPAASQPDLKAEIAAAKGDKAQADDARKGGESEGTAAPAEGTSETKAADDTFPGDRPSMADLERAVRDAAKKAKTGDELRGMLSDDYADDLALIQKNAPAAHATLKTYLDERLKSLDAQ